MKEGHALLKCGGFTSPQMPLPTFTRTLSRCGTILHWQNRVWIAHREVASNQTSRYDIYKACIKFASYTRCHKYATPWRGRAWLQFICLACNSFAMVCMCIVIFARNWSVCLVTSSLSLAPESLFAYVSKYIYVHICLFCRMSSLL